MAGASQSLASPDEFAAHGDPRLRDLVAELSLDGFTGPGAPSSHSVPTFAALRDTGSELWLDTGDHDAIATLWCQEFTALTTNNTLVNQVVQRGVLDDAMGPAARRLREFGGLSERALAFELGFIANARIALSLVQAFGAKVSVELHPAMAHTIPASLTFARRYFALCPERFIIKVPLQPAGFLVVRQLQREGIPVNYTLGFSARQNYLAARFSRPQYVNVFLGRLNAVVGENGLGEPDNIGEKATLASREAVHEARMGDPDIPTRQIAASVRNGQQIAALAGVDVFTMPPKAAKEFADLGLTRDELTLHTSRDLTVKLADGPWRSEVENLWLVSDEFRDYVDSVCAEASDDWDGAQFAEYTRNRGVHLFHDWTDTETDAVRAGGKAPKVADWAGVPLDDLMTQAALQAFAVDQKELDDRLAGLASKG